MKSEEIKDRFSKVVPRAKNLWQKYPVLVITIALVIGGAAFFVGLVVGK